LEQFYNPDGTQLPVVQKPTDYRLRTETETLDDFERLSKLGSGTLTAQAALELADKKFHQDGIQRRLQEILALWDPLAFDPLEHKLRKLEAQAVGPAELMRSIHAPTLLYRLLNEWGKDRLLQTPWPRLKTELDQRFEQQRIESLAG
jgi:hypothetical protein